MIKRPIQIFVFMLLLAAGWWLLGRMNLIPSFGDLFKSQPVRIDETPIQVEKIRELAELTTCVSLDEVVVDSIRPTKNPLGKLFSNPLGPQTDQLVLVVRGSVKAGVDLQKIMNEDMFRDEDSVSITLPRATITDIIVNPSGTETFIESGEWDTQAFSALVKKASDKMSNRAISEGLIGKADQRARTLVESLLRQSGFIKISVRTKYP